MKVSSGWNCYSRTKIINSFWEKIETDTLGGCSTVPTVPWAVNHTTPGSLMTVTQNVFIHKILFYLQTNILELIEHQPVMLTGALLLLQLEISSLPIGVTQVKPPPGFKPRWPAYEAGNLRTDLPLTCE